MKIIIKNRVESEQVEGSPVHNFFKTETGVSINGKSIDVLSTFKANSYLLIFVNSNNQLILIDGEKLQKKGTNGLLELRYGYLIKDYSEQVASVWYGNTSEDITVIINTPVFFLEENFEFEIKSGHNLEILKDIYPKAKEIFDIYKSGQEEIKASLNW